MDISIPTCRINRHLKNSLEKNWHKKDFKRQRLIGIQTDSQENKEWKEIWWCVSVRDRRERERERQREKKKEIEREAA